MNLWPNRIPLNYFKMSPREILIEQVHYFNSQGYGNCVAILENSQNECSLIIRNHNEKIEILAVDYPDKYPCSIRPVYNSKQQGCLNSLQFIAHLSMTLIQNYETILQFTGSRQEVLDFYENIR